MASIPKSIKFVSVPGKFRPCFFKKCHVVVIKGVMDYHSKKSQLIVHVEIPRAVNL
jgi:hypothetical protein